MTRDNVAPAGLPEKDWFTLDEIADRWGCSAEHVIHMGTGHHVELGVNVDHWSVAMAETVIEDSPEYASSSLPVLFWSDPDVKPGNVDEMNQPICEDVIWGFVGLHSEHIEMIRSAGFAAAHIVRWGSIAEQNFNAFVLSYKGSRTEDSRFPIVNGPTGDGTLARAPKVTADDLVMHRSERDRFEKKHRIGAHAGEMPDMETAGRWPWGDYETKLLRDLADAEHNFWSNYEPEKKGTAPTNDEVIAWLRSERGLSENMASAIATILRADDAPTGRRGNGNP